jgi:N-acetylglucosaminyl-diphospho-decaprenol L-rhamnosyltransferase
MPPHMHVAVCIVSFRNPGDVASCLGALSRSAYTDFEVIICENGGESAFSDLLRETPSKLASGQTITCLQASSNLGYAGGINLCMSRAASADAWWILNPDTLPDPNALARMCERLANGDCEAVGCTVHDGLDRVESRGGRWNRWFARAVSIDYGADVSAPGSPYSQPDLSYLSGASMLVGRVFRERVGLMREDYFLYGEEVEWCLRAVSKGVRLAVTPGAKVLHQQGTTTGSVSQVSRRSRMPVYLDERNKLLITRDCFPNLLPIAALGALTMLFLRFARRGAWAQVGYALDGWWNGVKNERGKPAWIAD